MKHREVREAEEFLGGMTGVAPSGADALSALQDACGHIQNLISLWHRQQEAEKVELLSAPRWMQDGVSPGTYIKQLEATDD